MAKRLPGKSSIGIELNGPSKNTLCFLVLFCRPKSPPKAREKSRIIWPGSDLLTKEGRGFGVRFIGFFGVVDPGVKFSQAAIAFRVRGISFEQLPYFADFPGSIGLGFQHGESFLRIEAESGFQRNGGQFEKFARRSFPGSGVAAREQNEASAKSANQLPKRRTKVLIKRGILYSMTATSKKTPFPGHSQSGEPKMAQIERREGSDLRALFHLFTIFFCAFRANAVGEFSMGAVADVNLNLSPVTLVISNLLAAGTNGQQAAQQLHLGKRCL